MNRPLTNMMIAPGLPAIQRGFNMHNDNLVTLAMTIYVLGFCVGPLVFAPLSEIYGRAVVYKGCLIMFLVFTLACGLSSSIEMLICFRFMAGCFGAAPVAIGGAMVYDLFRVSERGRAMSIYTFGPTAGNILGPPLGGFIMQHKSWRWIFWIMSALVCL
jgi:multidrug resistance protein